jgi:hypothetical protein
MAAILLFAGRLGAQEPASDGVLSGGDLSAKLRYRVESVEQEGPLRSALASTLRTSVAFETNPEFSGGVLVELEDVHAIGTEKYNSTTNGRTAYSVVPDPEGAELNQAYVSWHRPGIRARIGRQSIVLDNARFIGDAGFRQNQQTFDALTLQATTPGGSRFSYGYLARARRFLGDDHPLGDVDLRTHLLNYSFGRLNGDRLTAYAYLVEFDHAALRASSSQSLGASYDGSVDIGTRKLLYRAEYARQSDYADSPGRADAWYGNVEAGLRFAGQWTVGIGAEFLSGDGTDAFQTPLGTLHKFNGAADLFATATPADGLQDSYARVYVPIAGLRLTLTAHDFRSDNASRDYGQELDAEIEWRLNKHWQIGMKFASYEPETFGTDTRKGWAWVQGDF